MILVYHFQIGIALSHERLSVVVIVQLIFFTVVQVVERDSCHGKQHDFVCTITVMLGK